MAELFLHLDLSETGIVGRVVAPGRDQAVIRQEASLPKERIPVDEDSPDPGFSDIVANGLPILIEAIDTTGVHHAVITVPDHHVSYRTIQLPFGNEKKIRQVISFELETLLPLQDEPFIHDFSVIHKMDDAHFVFTASLLETIVASCFDILGPAGIRPVLIGPQWHMAVLCFAAIQEKLDEMTVLCLNEDTATLVVIKNKAACMVRSIPAGQAEPATIAAEVRRTMTGLSQRTGMDLPGPILIAGENSRISIDSLYSALGQEISKDPVDLAPYLVSVDPERPLKHLLNFCQGKFQRSSRIKAFLPNISAAAVLLLTVLALLLAGVSMDSKRLQAQVELLDSHAAVMFQKAFPDKRVVNDPYMELKAGIQAGLKKAGRAGEKQDHTGDDAKMMLLLSELSGRIDDQTDMEIERFLYNSGRLILSGTTDNFNSVDQIKTKLESSPRFKKVDISSAAMDKKGNRVDFKFVIDL